MMEATSKNSDVGETLLDPNAAAVGDGDIESDIFKQCIDNGKKIEELNRSVQYLQDLFLRRLENDKQKSEMIKTLQDAATYAVIEPFLSELILLLDRISGSDDDFVKSIEEELYDILRHRGVIKIEVGPEYRPTICRAVRVVEDSEVTELTVKEILRDGYIFSNRVLRPADVVVAKPVSKIQSDDRR